MREDEDLPDAVKFQQLKNSLLELARSAILESLATASNYRAAIDLLHQRHAKAALINRTSINEMFK